MGDGVLARTPWGEIAYSLAGKGGYERVRSSDEHHVAPGADTLRELFGGLPTLILLDELSVYLRKARRIDPSNDQLPAFLTSLFKAVEGTPNATVVYTLAIGKGGRRLTHTARRTNTSTTRWKRPRKSPLARRHCSTPPRRTRRSKCCVDVCSSLSTIQGSQQRSTPTASGGRPAKSRFPTKLSARRPWKFFGQAIRYIPRFWQHSLARPQR